MNERGYLEGSEMAGTFNMLRANDLIWSFVINNYLLGRDPFPFDLLHWNCDSTRMPAAMHSFYLRNLYMKNLLREPGGVTLAGVKIDLSKVTVPTYFVSAIEDHIAPWKTTYAGQQLMKGKTRFVLSGSGHIAGMINPPSANKYGYWTNEKLPAEPDAWFEDAKQHEGSWWTDWREWVDAEPRPRSPGARARQGQAQGHRGRAGLLRARARGRPLSSAQRSFVQSDRSGIDEHGHVIPIIFCATAVRRRLSSQRCDARKRRRPQSARTAASCSRSTRIRRRARRRARAWLPAACGRRPRPPDRQRPRQHGRDDRRRRPGRGSRKPGREEHQDEDDVGRRDPDGQRQACAPSTTAASRRSEAATREARRRRQAARAGRPDVAARSGPRPQRCRARPASSVFTASNDALLLRGDFPGCAPAAPACPPSALRRGRAAPASAQAATRGDMRRRARTCTGWRGDRQQAAAAPAAAAGAGAAAETPSRSWPGDGLRTALRHPGPPTGAATTGCGAGWYRRLGLDAPAPARASGLRDRAGIGSDRRRSRRGVLRARLTGGMRYRCWRGDWRGVAPAPRRRRAAARRRVRPARRCTGVIVAGGPRRRGDRRRRRRNAVAGLDPGRLACIGAANRRRRQRPARCCQHVAGHRRRDWPAPACAP